MKPTTAEMDWCRDWIKASFAGEAAQLPFSFVYGGQHSANLLARWQRKQTAGRQCGREELSQEADQRPIEHTLSFTDPSTGLLVRCEVLEYRDFPTMEWTLYFQNTGTADTPLLENIQAVDTLLQRGDERGGSAKRAVILHHHTGSPCTVADYQPFKTPLRFGMTKRITAAGGRPTNSDLPCFNIQADGEGVIVVVAWPGQWAAEFCLEGGGPRKDREGLRVRGGQEVTHLVLRPGEEIRTPRIVMQFWQGDRIRAHNLWRRWMLAHNLPKPGGKPLAPQFAVCNGNHFHNLLTNAADELMFTERYLREGIAVDYWWQDAGWYPNRGSWVDVGTWEVDRERFPGGIRAVSDRLRAQGVRTIVWFEPERVTPGSWLYDHHPEWLLGEEGKTKLLNLGDAGARRWLTERTDGLLTTEGIDLYRQDFNIDPLPFWRANDAPDRQGMTEIRYVEGYLAFWDELLRRHPGMLIDSCASGGRRNDLETLRRAVPLLRSDLTFVPFSDQCQTHGLALWLPYYGTGMLNPVAAEIPYAFRSAMCPHFTAGWDVRLESLDWSLIRRLSEQWRQIAPCYLGDYYPLTSYSLEPDVWMAWQFDRPDLGEGIVQVFRREQSPFEAARFRLCGLDSEAVYTLSDLDSGRVQEASGHELMEHGLPVAIDERPAAVVVRYRKGKHADSE